MNSHSPTAHMTDDALDRVMLGDASPADQQHLAACAACAARLAGFRTSITAFNQASSAWSQARSNTISRDLAAGRVAPAFYAAWSLASVTALAVALALTSQIHRSPDFPAQSPQSAPDSSSNRQQEIATDNAMLVAIDSELSQPVQSPVTLDRTDSASQTEQPASREVRD